MSQCHDRHGNEMRALVQCQVAIWERGDHFTTTFVITPLPCAAAHGPAPPACTQEQRGQHHQQQQRHHHQQPSEVQAPQLPPTPKRPPPAPLPSPPEKASHSPGGSPRGTWWRGSVARAHASSPLAAGPVRPAPAVSCPPALPSHLMLFADSQLAASMDLAAVAAAAAAVGKRNLPSSQVASLPPPPPPPSA